MVNCLGSRAPRPPDCNSGQRLHEQVLHANANLCGLRSPSWQSWATTGAPCIRRATAHCERPGSRARPGQPDQGFGRATGSRIPSNPACCRHTHSANYCIEKILSAHAGPGHHPSPTTPTALRCRPPIPTRESLRGQISVCIAAAINRFERPHLHGGEHQQSGRQSPDGKDQSEGQQGADEFKQDPNQ